MDFFPFVAKMSISICISKNNFPALTSSCIFCSSVVELVSDLIYMLLRKK